MSRTTTAAVSLHLRPDARRGFISGAVAVLWVALALIFAVAPATAAELTFPALSGRVVDDAGIIPAATRSSIEQKLADLEQKSGIQLVVATVKTLQGQEIEPYANQMFRTWQLGQKDKNNGALLLVAPNEKKVRIEVGYGLEGVLTDALSSIIIANQITPRFKANDFGGGIDAGVDGIIAVLTTDTSDWQARPQVRLDRPQGDHQSLSPALVIGILVALFIIIMVSPFRGIFLQILLSLLLSSGRGGGYSGGGGFGGGGGGFSGGGGSSGGGGASGGW